MAQINYDEEEYQDTKISAGTMRRIFGLAKPHRKWVLTFLVMIAFTSIFDSFFTYLGKQFIDEGIMAKDQLMMLRIMGFYIGLVLVQSACVFTFIFLAGVLGERIRYDLRKSMFNHLQELALAYFNQTPVGWIMARVTSDAERVSDLVTWGMLDSTWAVMNIATSMVFMMILNWKLGLIVFAAIPVLIFIAIQFRKRILVNYRLVRKYNSKITGAYNENITGVRVIKALGREE